MGGAQEPGRLSGAYGPPREVVWLIGWLTDRDCWLLRDYLLPSHCCWDCGIVLSYSVHTLASPPQPCFRLLWLLWIVRAFLSSSVCTRVTLNSTSSYRPCIASGVTFTCFFHARAVRPLASRVAR